MTEQTKDLKVKRDAWQLLKLESARREVSMLELASQLLEQGLKKK